MKINQRQTVRGIKWGLVVLLMITGISLVFAQDQGGRGFDPGGPPPMGGRGPFGGPPPFFRELNLSDEQKAKVKEINDGFAQSAKSYHEQLRALSTDPFDAAQDGAFDEATARASAEKRAAVQVELEVARARMMSQIYGLLTAEQKTKLAEIKQQFEQKREARRAARSQNTQ